MKYFVRNAVMKVLSSHHLKNLEIDDNMKQTERRTTMKACTNLSQSITLGKFLPIESADMDYIPVVNIDGEYSIGVNVWDNDHVTDEGWIPAWSLTALMSVMPKEEGSCTSISFGYYDANGNYVKSWLCCYEKEGESTDDYIIETIPADNPVDCCYEMILKLHEQKLL